MNAHPFWSPKKRGSQTLNATWEGSSGMKALTKKKSSCGDNMVHNLAQLKMSALLHSKASMAKMELGAGVRGGKKVGTDEGDEATPVENEPVLSKNLASTMGTLPNGWNVL